MQDHTPNGFPTPSQSAEDNQLGNELNEQSQADEKLNEIYGELSQEARQDKDSTDPKKSFLEGINPELFSEREREYKDTEKHWVRTKGWLRIAKEIAEETHLRFSRGIRYFTLPAYYRIDVSLFLRENLLEIIDYFPDGGAKKVYVAAFESDPTKYARMVGHFPEFHLFGDTSVEDALTNTANPYYDELLQLFPFDIVNLDLTTSLTPQHEGPYSRTMKAIDAVFKRQSEYGSKWALFLTFRNMPDEWEQITLEQLFENLQRNLDEYPQVLEAFDKLYHETRVNRFYQKDPQRCISQSVIKWLADRASANNLRLESMNCYYYARPLPSPLTGYSIYKQVLVFSKGTVHPGIVPTKGTPIQPWMPNVLVQCVTQHKPIDVAEKILITLDSRPAFEDEMKQDIDALCSMIA